MKRVGKAITRVDLFGTSPAFSIDGHSSYGSLCGAAVSVVIFATVFAFSLRKYEVMTNFEDTRFQEITVKNFHNNAHEFRYEETRFNIAIGVFDSLSNHLNDRRFFEIKAELTNFNVTRGSEDLHREIPLELRPCTENDRDVYWQGELDQI